MLNTVSLEQIATTLREILEIDPKKILNHSHLEELSKKIEAKFENFKIVRDVEASCLLLENEHNFTLYICGNDETCFYDLVEQFTFAIILDKKSLNSYELQRSVFRFPRITTDGGASNYLMMAFMMPSEAFYSALVKYSSGDGSSIHMFEMQKEVNKYCHKRGKDLRIW